MNTQKQTIVLRRLGLLTAAVLCAIPSGSKATILRPLSIQALTRHADIVVRATVLSTSSRWRHSRIYTGVLVQVKERWLCKLPGSSKTGSEICKRNKLRLWTMGGRVGRIEQKVFGAPRLRKGTDMVLFLSKRKGGLFVTGMAQGAFLVRRVGSTTWALRSLGGVRWKGRLPVARIGLHRLEKIVQDVAKSQGRMAP